MKMVDLKCNFAYFRVCVFKVLQIWHLQFKMSTFKIKTERVVDVLGTVLLNRVHSGKKELSV